MATAREKKKKKKKDRISKFQSRIRKIRCHQCSIFRDAVTTYHNVPLWCPWVAFVPTSNTIVCSRQHVRTVQHLHLERQLNGCHA